MTDLYQVVGNPIGHSLSPTIHKAFALQTGEDIDYRAQLMEPSNFKASLSAQLRSGEIKGANVTVPFKELAWELAERRSQRAELAGAANTLYLDDEGRITADNTDGLGLVADLELHNDFKLSGKRILVLGAGGAVRGVIHSLLEAGVSQLVLANRTVSKAKYLAELFNDSRIQACGFSEVPRQGFDLVVNGTSASLSGALPPIPADVIGQHTLAYDMVYGPEPTPFCNWAAGLGASAIDGLGMLVEQAAEAFLIWRGVRPDTFRVLKQIRAEITDK